MQRIDGYSALSSMRFWLAGLMVSAASRVITLCCGSSTVKSQIIPRLSQAAFEYWRKGDLFRAHVTFQLILTVNPNDIGLVSAFTQVLHERGFLDYALELVERQVEMHPNNVNLRIHLINWYLLMDMTREARKCAESAEQLAHGSVILDFAWGMIHRAEGNLDLSNTVLKRVYEAIQPTSENLHISVHDDPAALPYLLDFGFDTVPIRAKAIYVMSDNYSDLGGRREAIRLLEELVDESPLRSSAKYFLARMKYYESMDHPHIQSAIAALASGSLSTAEQVPLHFMFGEVFDSCGEFDEAFRHYQRANDLEKTEKGGLIARRQCEKMENAMKVFDHTYFAERFNDDSPCRGERLVFIVGMPRTGSTLVEQILSCHPDVYAGGELHHLTRYINALSKECPFPDDYPYWILRLNPETIEKMATSYYSEYVTPYAGDRWFVDKTLSNCEHLGFLTALFPGAKFVYCKRNPVDTCLSIYFTHFQGIEFSNDLHDIASMFKATERLMDHWRAVLPVPILELEYETTVTSPESTIRRLLEFCGLSWNDSCLEFYANKRMVSTASIYQVKRPIYSSSVGRWRNYEKHLGSLVDDLATQSAYAERTGIGQSLAAHSLAPCQ
jgi:tetratricopeptide (TPR) repeat protein